MESGCGFTSMRTAGSELPPTETWPTPLTCASFCANTDEAMSYSCGLGTTSDSSVISRIGWSAGLIFRYFGRDGRFAGRVPAEELMAACTSRPAELMSRLRSNWSVTEADPTELLDVISVTPAMRVNCFSSGVATDAAITSGLAPGSDAWTVIVGKSTAGSADTGSNVYAMPPAIVIATRNSVVATGR